MSHWSCPEACDTVRRKGIVRLLVGLLGLLLTCVPGFRPGPSALALAKEPAHGAHHAFVSLAPNLTEILFAIGAGPEVVGVTAQCDFPADVETGVKSGRITRVGDYTSPSLERVMALKPDVVLATEGNPRDGLERLKSKGIRVVEVHAQTADALSGTVETVGKETGHQAEAERLSDRIRKALARLEHVKRPRRKSLLVLQFDPIYSVNDKTWLGDLFRVAGFDNIVKDSALKYPVVSPEVLLAKKPDLVFTLAPANDAARQRAVKEDAEKKLARLFPEKSALPKVVVLPEDAFVRPGPRLLDAIDLLADGQF